MNTETVTSALTENMNLGTRYDSYSAASAFLLIQRYESKKPVPFVLYAMPDVQSGWDALAELPFMESAADTGSLITDRLAQYGSYEYASDGKSVCEAFVASNDISAEEFVDTAEIFARHGGVMKENYLPSDVMSPDDGAISPVKYERKESFGGAVYDMYSADNRASAIAYLRGHDVKRVMYYIIVETPDGRFGRDRFGMFGA